MIQIKTLSYDDEYDMKIRIQFRNDLCSSYLDIYAQRGIFEDFAKKLIDFPFATARSIKFEYGEDIERWAYYLLIKVDVIDSSGKILIKTIVDNKGDEVDHYRCEFR